MWSSVCRENGDFAGIQRRFELQPHVQLEHKKATKLIWWLWGDHELVTYIMYLRRISSSAKIPKIRIDHLSQRVNGNLSPNAPIKISICKPCIISKNAAIIYSAIAALPGKGIAILSSNTSHTKPIAVFANQINPFIVLPL